MENLNPLYSPQPPRSFAFAQDDISVAQDDITRCSVLPPFPFSLFPSAFFLHVNAAFMAYTPVMRIINPVPR